MTHPAHPLIVADNGDTYYVGDLAAGQKLVSLDRYPSVTYVEEHAAWLVELCDDEAYEQPAEWGSSTKSEEDAWRYAIGAALGPMDEGYDESRLIAMLQVVTA